MGKFKRLLSFLVNISLIGGTYYVSNAASLAKKEINKVGKILNSQKGNIKNKVETEVKKYVGKKTKDDNKTSEKNKNAKVADVEKSDENSQIYFKIPLKINNCNSQCERAIFLESLYDKLFEKNVLKDTAKPLGLADKYDLYSIVLNDNKQDAIYVSTEKSNEKKLRERINSDEFRKFIENFKITSEDFKKSKENIDKTLKHDKENVEKNIRNYKLGENVDFMLPFSNKQDKDLTKNYYDSKIKPFIRTFDRRLIDSLNVKSDNSIFSDQFFKSSLKNVKQSNIDEFNKTLGKFTSNKDGLFDKFKKVSFGSNISNVNVRKSGEPEKKETIQTYALNGLDGITGMHEFSPSEIAVGLFGGLNLNNQEKLGFKHYYEGKLKEYNNKSDQQRNEQNKRESKSILNHYVNSYKKLKSDEEKEKDKAMITEFESILNDDAKLDEFSKEYGDLKKSYFENFVNLLKDVKKEEKSNLN